MIRKIIYKIKMYLAQKDNEKAKANEKLKAFFIN